MHHLYRYLGPDLCLRRMVRSLFKGAARWLMGCLPSDEEIPILPHDLVHIAIQ